MLTNAYNSRNNNLFYLFESQDLLTFQNSNSKNIIFSTLKTDNTYHKYNNQKLFIKIW